MVIPKTYGRMGNFLFQAACAMGYAWRHGLEYTLPSKTSDPRSNPIYLQHLVDPKLRVTQPVVELKEVSHAYNTLPFKEEWRQRTIVLDGYWQTEKYFKEFRDRVLEAMRFPWESKAGTVSVHVRRTDYLKLAHKHPPVTPQWLDAAMAKFPGAQFHFFSDDTYWCQQWYGRKRKDCVVHAGSCETEDLIAMSCCEHNICSASTFSWWGAWLNRNPAKRVVIPNWWFTPGWDKLDTSDIVPMEWERMGNGAA